MAHVYNGNLLISSGNTQPQRNVQSGDILERQEPTIKAADDATSCLSFINRCEKWGFSRFDCWLGYKWHTDSLDCFSCYAGQHDTPEKARRETESAIADALMTS